MRRSRKQLNDRRPHSGNCQERGGFSLIDVTVTVLIMGIMAAVAAPKIGDTISNYRVQAATERIAADLKLAQQHARTTGSSETVSFDIANSRYTFSSIEDADSAGTPYSVDISDGPYESSIQSAAFGASTDVTFDGYGFTTDNGTISVTSGGVSGVVKLYAASGRITAGRTGS